MGQLLLPVQLRRTPAPTLGPSTVPDAMDGRAPALAALTRPNIVTVHDFGRARAGFTHGVYLWFERVQCPVLVLVVCF